MDAPEELATFCTLEHPRLVGALTLYTGEHALAEELAQEALVRACERWSKVSRMDAPGAWVHRVAMNLAKSRFRRRAVARRVAARTRDGGVEAEPMTAEVLAVRDAVAQLPGRQREAVVLRHFVGWSIEDTAAAMGVSSSALRSLTHRAMQRLEILLADDESEASHVG